jgi:hypothetical protein
VKKTAKQKRKSVDYSNVLLALPFCPLPAKKMVPGAAGKERAATNNNTTGGGPSSKYPLHNNHRKENSVQ